MGLITTTLTSTGSVLASVGPAMLNGVHLSTSGDTCILEIHNCATTGLVAADNKQFRIIVATDTPNSFTFDGTMFPAGIVVKCTLGDAGPVDLNIEFE